MLTRKYIQLSVIILISGIFCFRGLAQVSDASDVFRYNSILDISDLRPSLPDQFIKQIFVRDSTYTYAAIPLVGNEWVLESKTINTYDNQGRRTALVRSDLTSSGWVNRQRILNAYNDENLIGVRQSLRWNDSLSIWMNDEQRTFSYNPFGLEDEVVIQNWNVYGWNLSERILKTYNLNDKVDAAIQYMWESVDELWIEHTRTLYTYNELNLVEEMIIQIWVDSTSSWLNHTRNTYEYDANEKVVLSTYSTWNPYADDFTESSFITLIYNDKGQISSTHQMSLVGTSELGVVSETANYDTDGNLGNVVQTIWDEDNQEWENFRRHEHFWSKRYIGNLDSNPEEITCTFSNPYEIGQPWFCESLKKDVVYRVDVFDLLGRSYHQSYIMGGYSFRIDGQIPSGIYVVVLSGGLDVHTEKVVIR